MKIYFLILFILFFFSSVYAVEISDEKKIKHALLEYNYGIVKMTKSGNTKLLKDKLPKEVYFKLMIWADSWKFSNLAMVARINDIRFSPISYNENNATIKTLENWTYGYANLIDKNFALEPRNIFYKMQYTLKKDADSWMIVAIDILEEEEFENKNLHQPELKQKTPDEDVLSQPSQGKIATH